MNFVIAAPQGLLLPSLVLEKAWIVFADIQQTKAFVGVHGGDTASFAAALDVSRAAVAGENTMLVAKRLKKGKIVESRTDDRCVVCEMFPSRYPKNKCRLHAKDRKIFHYYWL